MNHIPATALTLALATLLGACSPEPLPVEALRPVRTAEIRYDATREANRYAGTVQSRFEVDQAFRVGGKVARRLVDVGQVVHEGDVLAVLYDADYRLAEEAARQQWTAAVAQARQAESDRQRLGALKADGLPDAPQGSLGMPKAFLSSVPLPFRSWNRLMATTPLRRPQSWKLTISLSARTCMVAAGVLP